MDDLQYLSRFVQESYFQLGVLNLVINGWPSILLYIQIFSIFFSYVLNLVINGWPSIQNCKIVKDFIIDKFVLNLVINGWPSIQRCLKMTTWWKCMVLNLVINGWPSILES